MERRRERERNAYAANLQKMRKQRREYARKWRKEHPKEAREADRKYRSRGKWKKWHLAHRGTKTAVQMPYYVANGPKQLQKECISW